MRQRKERERGGERRGEDERGGETGEVMKCLSHRKIENTTGAMCATFFSVFRSLMSTKGHVGSNWAYFRG